MLSGSRWRRSGRAAPPDWGDHVVSAGSSDQSWPTTKRRYVSCRFGLVPCPSPPRPTGPYGPAWGSSSPHSQTAPRQSGSSLRLGLLGGLAMSCCQWGSGRCSWTSGHLCLNVAGGLAAPAVRRCAASRRWPITGDCEILPHWTPQRWRTERRGRPGPLRPHTPIALFVGRFETFRRPSDLGFSRVQP